MAVLLRKDRADEWNRYVQQRVQGPLRPIGSLLPETLNSVYLIVPGSSGDVILATTVVRYIKDRNPQCHIAFAVKRANLPLVTLCPGVDEAVEWPKESSLNPRSRNISLMRYSGKADVVLYPICDPEDMDLLVRYNFLETIWMLSGIPDGLPAESLPFWITPPNDAMTVNHVLSRCFSKAFAAQLFVEAGKRPVKPLAAVLLERKIKNTGWNLTPKHTIRLLRNASYVRRLPKPPTFSEAADKLIIISNEANMFPPPAKGLFEAIIRFFRARGRIVLQNVLKPVDALPGTVPLVCSYHEFLCLRSAGIPFIGWRSGLCDIAATAPAPMCAVYPSSFEDCGDNLQATMAPPTELFGFASMNIATSCIEIVCDSAADLNYEKLMFLLEH